jgi:tetratricopeptide (TPR) repeat protein
MSDRLRSHAVIVLLFALLCASLIHAQTSSNETADVDDAVKLFQQGQDAHEAGDLKRALELYEQAIKLRPEFPEAEFQRAKALMSLNRLPEAEKGFRRAIELQPEWSVPYTALGKMLDNAGRYDEAEKILSRAVELDDKNVAALIALTHLRVRAKAPREKLQPLLEALKRATEGNPSNGSAWVARAIVEIALEHRSAAEASLDRALLLNSRDVTALQLRAQLRALVSNYQGAVTDAVAANLAAPSVNNSLLLARIYAQAGRTDDAVKTLDALDEASKALPEVVVLRTSLQKDCNNSTKEDRAATEELLKQQPHNATLLSCLGASLRTVDPARSLELYRQAAESEPKNIRYATGYAAALVQARRFAEAVVIFRRILAIEPDNFTARTNLATALYELKQYPAALTEFKTLIAAKPDLVVAYYFIATAYDFLGQYPEALAAYEMFVARADAQKNQLEIDKVNLRLPTLRNQVKRGEGAKKKKQ